MWRPVPFCLASALFLAGSLGASAHDYRIAPDSLQHGEFAVSLPERGLGGIAPDAAMADGSADLPREYASAMVWYRVALMDGYEQPPIVARDWSYDEGLPEPLHWVWIGNDGDLVARTGRGVFRLSFADNRVNWFREVECRLQSWPDGDAKAPMNCSDGLQRTMQIPGDGIVFVDDVEYRRVFASEETTLPPEEIISIDDVTAAAIAGEPLPLHDGLSLPANGPLAPDK